MGEVVFFRITQGGKTGGDRFQLMRFPAWQDFLSYYGFDVVQQVGPAQSQDQAQQLDK